MNKENYNSKNIAYLIICVITLVVAVTGATFAYFTATDSATGFTGNMATIEFGLEITKVTKVDESKGGMIPMSNTMVEHAVSDSNITGGSGSTCVDDNGNAVCQIYKITVTNKGSASMFLDGYVSLTDGSGVPTDFTGWTDYDATEDKTETYPTTMRWAQVFCAGAMSGDNITACSTIGKTTTGATSTTVTGIQETAITSGITASWSTLGKTTEQDSSGFNTDNIVINNDYSAATVKVGSNDVNITAKGAIAGNPYDIINTNYIRVSDHKPGNAYTRTTDATSALVFNQYLDAESDSITTDEVVYYIVVWLSETGTNQTVNNPAGTNTNDSIPTTNLNFFTGTVSFISAQGSEVTGTFSGYTAVRSDQLPTVE